MIDFSIFTVKKICSLLKNGFVISFPTETVYGLGVDATNTRAVEKIFVLKGRPKFNPLIIHVASLKEAQKYGFFSDTALVLANKFWPAPITIIIKARKNSPLSYLVYGGLDTIALRIPSSIYSQIILRYFGMPIAAPSANISNYISPTCIKHVVNDFPKLSIVNSGICGGGIESTIIDFSEKTPCVLRPGPVTNNEVDEYRLIFKDINLMKIKKRLISPGEMICHYSPKSNIRLNIIFPKKEEVFIGFGNKYKNCYLNLSKKGCLQEASYNLFFFLRRADINVQKVKAFGISIAPIPNIGLGVSINNRLKKASSVKKNFVSKYIKTMG